MRVAEKAREVSKEGPAAEGDGVGNTEEKGVGGEGKYEVDREERLDSLIAKVSEEGRK